MEKQELIAEIRAHALKNYEKDGWDFLVECYSDEEILEEIGNATTLRGAIWKLRKVLTLHDEQRRAVRNEIF